MFSFQPKKKKRYTKKNNKKDTLSINKELEINIDITSLESSGRKF